MVGVKYKKPPLFLQKRLAVLKPNCRRRGKFLECFA
jgi:hypothetical protein